MFRRVGNVVVAELVAKTTHKAPTYPGRRDPTRIESVLEHEGHMKCGVPQIDSIDLAGRNPSCVTHDLLHVFDPALFVFLCGGGHGLCKPGNCFVCKTTTK